MLTEKQKLYAKARLKGLNQTQSAIAAGYSPATARQSASRLEKDPLVIAHMDRLSKVGEVSDLPKTEPKAETPKPGRKQVAQLVPEKKKQTPDPKINEVEKEYSTSIYTDLDPLEFMRQLVSDMTEDPKLRLEAAKALAPYLHAKQGEMGKKEAKQQAADNVKNGRFGLRQVK
jgi:phage terminase small subunit